jgi:hypothetical protein
MHDAQDLRRCTERITAPPMKIETVAKFLFTLISIGVLALSGYLLYGKLKFIMSAERVQGQVIDLQHVRSTNKNNTDGTWRPVVRFRAPSGALIDFTTSSSSGTPRYETGESIQVFFQPSDPADALLDDPFELWGGPAMAGIIGAVFSLFAWFLWRIGRDEKTQA